MTEKNKDIELLSSEPVSHLEEMVSWWESHLAGAKRAEETAAYQLDRYQSALNVARSMVADQAVLVDVPSLPS